MAKDKDKKKMSDPVEKGGKKPRAPKNPGALVTVQDPRFSSVHSDPRFQRFPQKKQKIEIDSRFSAMFTDKKFRQKGAIDKRGRSLGRADETQKEDLKKYYRLEGNEEQGSEDEDDDNAKQEEDALAIPERPAHLRGIRGSDSEASSSEDEDGEDEEEDVGDIHDLLTGGADMWEDAQEQVEYTDATDRLAVMDLNWERVRAVDILVILRSFAPKGGAVRKVTVFPSEFGMKRMAAEEKYGPLAALREFDEGDEADQIPEEDEDGGDDESDDKEEDAEKKKHNLKLRAYERGRLRYYYAVVEFDSAATASHVYQECDGAEYEPTGDRIELRVILKYAGEYEPTGDRMELRYIPEGTEFDDYAPRDVAVDVPRNYRPPDFQVSALKHTEVKISWDDDAPERRKVA
eukprot:gene18225-21714_t